MGKIPKQLRDGYQRTQIITLMDDNLNTLPNADLTGRGYIRDMIDQYESF